MCAAYYHILVNLTRHRVEDLLLLAKLWVEECGSSYTEVPGVVVEHCGHSALCMCTWSDCFHSGLQAHRQGTKGHRCNHTDAFLGGGWERENKSYSGSDGETDHS